MSRMLRMSESQLAGRKPSKYCNVKKTVDGIPFDSTREARRWQELKLLAHAGEIHDLKFQPKIVCQANGVHICDYIGDFFYTRGGLPIYEDVKSEHTRKLPVYRLKRRIVLALTDIEILET